MAVKKTPGINGSSMADISFILLIFFLMVTTMGSDYGLIRQLPPMQDKPNNTGEKINERNVFVVNVNQHNNLQVKGQLISIADLREKAKAFFNIQNTGAEFPEKREEDVPLLGKMMVNRTAVVSLQNDRGTSYKTYIQVQNELAAAIHELRDEICMQKFAKKFEDCTQDQQDAISKKVYPMAISEAEPKNIGGNR